MRHIAGISTATLESVFCGCWFIVIDETAKDENICNGVSLESSPEAQQEISPEIQYNQAGTGITTDGQEYGYTYDLAGRVAGSDTVQGTAGGYMRTYSRYVYEDKTNRLSEYNVRMPKSGTTTQTRLQPFEFVYGTGADIDRVTYVKLMNQEVLGYGYDGFGRLVTRSYESTSGSTARSTAYTYLDGAGTGRTSTLVGTVNNSGLGVLGYSYDAVGNITGITKDGAAYESYTYDDLNQLSSVTRSGVTTNYAYTNGNISSVTRAGVAVKTYTYGNTVWKDLLTAYNGTAITYDTIGNPLSYRGMSMTWQNGRQLAGITKTGYNISYTYGADGERISKSVNGVTTRFYTTNGQTVGFNTSDGKDFAYIFDGSGAVCGLTYENYGANAAAQNYYFAFNAQGDVIGIYSSSGAVVAKYEYDEWGKPLSVTDGAGTDVSANSSHIANLNPFRYRGYYYDSETGFYATATRYYDPEVGRFINADSQLNAKDGLLGYNLFAYCENNPIVYYDPTGHSLLAIVGLGFLFVGMAVCFTSSTHANNSINSNFQYSTNNDPINPSIPPNPESGYVPPKKNPNPGKVKNPNGAGKGWPSNNGGVWVPNNNQDGGPGWTVQFPDGGHEHRYPDGHVRSHNFSNSYGNVTNVLIGGSIIIGTGIGIIIIMADDTTGIGMLDNVTLPALFGAFSKGVQMVAG